MSDLAQLQQQFKNFILDGDDAIACRVQATERVPVATRLSIYADAYRSRLAEALASNAPRLQQLLGDDAFSVVAQRYIEEHPSKFASIRWFGGDLAQSLERSHASKPWLAELARWEWAIASTFDALDAQAIGIERLAGVAPEDWPGLSFRFHPSIQRLDVRTNAPALFKALSEELPVPEPVVLDELQPWLIWRQELKTQYRSLSANEAAAIDAMRGRGTFEEMCDLLREWHTEEAVPVEAAGMLKRWIVDALVIDCVTSPGA